MVADIAQIGRADAAGKMIGRGYLLWRHIENRDDRVMGKASTRSLRPTRAARTPGLLQPKLELIGMVELTPLDLGMNREARSATERTLPSSARWPIIQDGPQAAAGP
jgi:hypothetical protein